MAVNRDKAEKTLSSEEIAAFCEQIALILKSGIPVEEGVAIMKEDADNASGKEILSKVLDGLEQGESFHESLGGAGVFPKYMVDMAEIGERSGRLDDVMDSLRAYYEREREVKSSIRSAVTYPMVMIFMMLLVILVLVVKVMPIFNQVFLQLGAGMTGFAQNVMGIGNAIGKYAAAVTGAAALLIVAFLILRRLNAKLFSHFFDTFFLTRRLAAKMAAGRFASAMALMLASGLDTGESLDMAYKLVDNDATRKKIERCKSGMAGGETFAAALSKADIFDGLNSRMVTVGFKAGSIDGVMQRISDRYTEDVNDRINSMVSILEPTLVAILSVVVGLILLSVMLPLMGIMSSIG